MIKNKCKVCNGTYFIRGKHCAICNKGTLPPKTSLWEKIKGMYISFRYWYLPF